ncbi:MAG TPA: hypothetical protein VGB76_16930 [Pyrinomonadaceae bacterium]
MMLAIIFTALVHDAYLLFRYPVAVGVDGYYYVLQVENLHDRGTLFFPNSTPLVIYLLVALKFFVSSTVLAIKVGSFLFHLALAAGVFALLKTLTRSRMHAMCGTLIIGASSVHLFMLSEYIAHSGGLALLVWGAYFTVRAVRTGNTWWKGGAVIALVLASLSHRSCIFMIAVLAVMLFIYHLIMTPVRVNRRRTLTAGAVGLAFFISPLVFAGQTFVALSPEVRDESLASPGLSFGRVAILEKCLLLLCSLLFLVISFKHSRRRQTFVYKVLGTISVLSLLMTLNPFLDRSGGWLSASERISALAYIQLAILLPGLFWLLSPSVGRLARPLCVASVICFSAFSLVISLPYGLRDDYLHDRIRLIKSLTEQRQALTHLRRVIAPHGEQFVITYSLGVPAQQRVTPGEDLSTTHWLLQHFDRRNLNSVEGVIVLDEQQSTFIVPDKHLDAILRAMPLWEGLELTKANPHLIDRILSGTNTYRLPVR